MKKEKLIREYCPDLNSCEKFSQLLENYGNSLIKCNTLTSNLGYNHRLLLKTVGESYKEINSLQKQNEEIKKENDKVKKQNEELKRESKRIK